MPFCVNCGRELEDNEKFCTNCGTQLGALPVELPVSADKEKADEMINEVFGKAIGAVICAEFPVASIVGIVLGNKVLKTWKKARAMADEGGFRLTPKNIPVRILGIVGKISGIVMTVVWAYLFIVWIIMAATAGMVIFNGIN